MSAIAVQAYVRFAPQLFQLIRLALPLIASTGCFSLTLFVDRTLLMWFHPTAAAAAMAAGNLYWTLACLPVAAVGFSSTLVAQRVGRGREEGVGPVVWQALWFSVLFLPVFAACIWFAEPLFGWFEQPPELKQAEIVYFRILMLTAPAAMFEGGLFAYFAGRGRTQAVMYVVLLASVMNLLFDGLLIFGWGFVPSLGVAGAAAATALSAWFKVFAFAVLIAREKSASRFGLRNWKPDGAVLFCLGWRGLALGGQQVIRSAALSALLLNIGRAGANELAATSMVLSLNQLATMPLIGLATATTICVAQSLGRHAQQRLGTLLTAATSLAVVYAAAIALFYLLFPETSLRCFSWGGATDPAAELQTLTHSLLGFSAVLLIAEALGQILVGAIRGTGDTHVTLAIIVISSLAAVGVGMTCRPATISEVRWWWMVLTGWSVLQTALSAMWLGYLTTGRSFEGEPAVKAI